MAQSRNHEVCIKKFPRYLSANYSANSENKETRISEKYVRVSFGPSGAVLRQRVGYILVFAERVGKIFCLNQRGIPIRVDAWNVCSRECQKSLEETYVPRVGSISDES